MFQNTTFKKYHISKTIASAEFLLLQKEAELIMGSIIIVGVCRRERLLSHRAGEVSPWLDKASLWQGLA